MVGIVLVSHSRALANAALTLVRAMAGNELPIAIAAGAGENHEDLGTDATEIYEAITNVDSADGVLVLMDMGSAVLSAEMALEFLDDDTRTRVCLCAAPFIEGAVAAGVSAKIGSPLADIEREAMAALTQKTEHIAPTLIDNRAELPISGENALTVTIKIPMPNGLHARPVANLIQEAAKYDSNIQIRNLTNGKGPVSVRSMTGIVSLEALYNNDIELIATGNDALVALNDLKKAIESGLGDDLNFTAKPATTQVNQNNQFAGNQSVGISKGIVIGPVYCAQTASFEIKKETIENASAEVDALHAALSVTIAQLNKKAENVSNEMGKAQGEIFAAQALVLQDPVLLESADNIIKNDKVQAAYAWWLAINSAIKQYNSLDNANLRQRALDLQDASDLVLQNLGVKVNNELNLPVPSILVIDDITPGQVAALDKSKTLGVICFENGPTSHSAILLRSQGIPAIVQAKSYKSELEKLPLSTIIALNGETGDIWINPDEEQTREITILQNKWIEQSTLEKQQSAQIARTTDGVQIEVLANIGHPGDSLAAVENGADGVGLLRTEFMFLHRTEAPSEDEQYNTLLSMIEPFNGKPVTIRTLDAGGDKEIPYLDMPKEANPFLGVRAIRLCLRNPELFQQQLRAILRVGAEYGNIKIMFPLISTVDELMQAKLSLYEAHTSLVNENISHLWPVATGMMMEVPSAAIRVQDYVNEVDFVSIGTNDLTQYTLAVDRGNTELQKSIGKNLDISVLTLIKHIVDVCKMKGKPVSVCGESAADIKTAALLLGIGVDKLSMNARSIPEIKYWIRNNAMYDLKLKAESAVK